VRVSICSLIHMPSYKKNSYSHGRSEECFRSKKKPVKNAYGHCIYKNYHCIFRLYTLKAKLKNILILFKPFLF